MKKEKENTVFILGAGANVPYGFPTSSTLRKDIIDNFADIFSSIYRRKNKFDEYDLNDRISYIKKFQKDFDISSIYSIDYFIYRNSRYIELGKDAIILHLLEYERNCKFRENSVCENADWYSYIYNFMISNLKSAQSLSRISENLFTFITFNYDRSLEYFLAESFGHSFEGITQQQLKEVMSKIPIIHVYGKIDNLPFSRNESGLNFGGEISYEDLTKLRGNIRIINDNIGEIMLSLSDIITDAERIFFLGFGYDKTNLTNLGFPSSLNVGQKIYGTTLGYNDRFIDELKEYFNEGNLISQHKKGYEELHSFEDSELIFESIDSLALLKNHL